MTSLQDLFVGIVAVLFGCLLTLGAIMNSARLMALAKPRYLAERFGNTIARAILAAIGITIAVMGTLIATGWRVR